MKKALKIIAIILGAILLFVIGFFGYAAITEFKPEAVEELDISSSDMLLDKNEITIFSLNTGYAGLDASMDFFMDGGSGVNPDSKEEVETNIAGIESILESNPADFYLLQEVDFNSTRSFHINEEAEYLTELASRVSAENFVTKWLPYPWPMIGKVDSGIVTLSSYAIEKAERVALPTSFTWPSSMFNLKRCLEVNYIPLENSDNYLVLVNLHLEAYDEGEGKIAQTKLLWNLLEEEYAAGNYVIAGGDFNQLFPGAADVYPVNEDLWKPGYLETSALPEGWQYAYDLSSPSCRSLDKAYTGRDGHIVYLIDGFIVSPNVTVESTQVIDYDFEYTDHNPVIMKAVLE